MKSLSTWQLVLLLAAFVGVVFLVTIVSMYVVGSGPGKTSSVVPGVIHLRFPGSTVEWEGLDKNGTGEFEAYVEGYYDFWFENLKDQTVKLGVKDMYCKCSRLEVGLVPDKYKEELNKLANDHQRALRAKDLDLKLDWQPLPVGKLEAFDVPAKAAGWMRLSWKSERIGQDGLTAKLRTKLKDEEAEVDLALPITLLEPVRVEPDELDVQLVTESSKPPEGGWSFLFWSATRPDFTLKLERSGHPCIVLGEPVKVGEPELEGYKKMGRKVLCAYRVPVTVSEQANGQQLDLGPFRLPVVFTAKGPDADLGTITAYVRGRVQGQGDVVVRSTRSSGETQYHRIDLGMFSARTGKTKEAVIETDASVLRIEYDKEKTEKVAEFLKIEITPDKENSNPNQKDKSWTIRVAVSPRGFTGRFGYPDARDNPAYRDIAIYLKMEQERDGKKQWRNLRIPIAGEATN